MGWLIVFVIGIAGLCFALSYVPSAGVIKLLLTFLIGFVVVWALVKMFEEFD